MKITYTETWAWCGTRADISQFSTREMQALGFWSWAHYETLTRVPHGDTRVQFSIGSGAAV